MVNRGERERGKGKESTETKESCLQIKKRTFNAKTSKAKTVLKDLQFSFQVQAGRSVQLCL